MAENVGAIYYEVDAKTDKLTQAANQADASLDRMQKGFAKTDAAAARNTKATKAAGDGVADFSKKADAAAGASGRFTAKLSPLSLAIGSVISIEALRRLQALSEEFTVLGARVDRLSGSVEQGAANYTALLNIANKTGATMTTTVKLWESLTMTLRELGGNDAQIIRLTETLQKIGTVGGSSAEEMANALRQLGQALAGGVLRAEEFNSIVENMPSLAREIAAGLGVPFGELRKMLLDGELTAERVLGAIQKRTGEVDAEFAKLPRTVGQAGTAMVNSFGDALSKLDDTLGVSLALSQVMDLIAEKTRRAAGNLTENERYLELIQEQYDVQVRLAAAIENTGSKSKQVQYLTAELDRLNKAIMTADKAYQKQKAEEAAPVGTGGTTGGKGTPESLKALETLREQAEVAKLAGVERAKLIAVQKLGTGATKEEVAEAERLATAIYEQENARKANTAATKVQAAEQKKEQTEAERGAVRNAEVIAQLEAQLANAALSGRALAEAQAVLKLNEYATPEQIARVKELAAAMQAREQAAANKQLLGQVDPIAGEQQNFETEIANLKKLNEAKLLEDQRYLELKMQAEVAHDEQMRMLQEENFRRQSMGNELLMASLDQLSQGATNALVGLVTGASNGEEAIRSLAGAILNQAVGALVEMGAQYVKNLIMGETAAAAAAATGAATAATLASAYATPAALVSLASFGANAAPASAGIASTVSLAQGMALAGGRQYGGPVNAGSMYQINENGAPEVFNANNGKQYMLPNRRGEVVSNADATGQATGDAPTVIVNVQQNRERAGQVDRTQSGNSEVVDVFVADIMGDGPMSGAISRKWGLKTQGT